MIDEVYGKFIVVCDICESDGAEEMKQAFDTFQDAVDGKKDLGYESVCHDGEWVDVCPQCQE